MPEENNNNAAPAGDGGGENQQPGAGGDQPNEVDTGNKPGTDPNNGNGGGGEGGGDGGEKTPTGEDKNKAKAPTDEGSQNGVDDGKDPEVKSRKSAKDFIIQRQQKKIAKLSKKEGDQPGNAGDGSGDNGEGGDDDEVAPEDRELIEKVVSPMIKPVLEKTLEAEDEQELKEFLKDNPDFKPYEAKARRFMKHPSRRQLPVKSIFYEVAGDDLMKIGAKRKEEADKKAKDSQTGGGSERTGDGGAKNAWQMSKEEFEAEQERVRRGNQ